MILTDATGEVDLPFPPVVNGHGVRMTTLGNGDLVVAK